MRLSITRAESEAMYGALERRQIDLWEILDRTDLNPTDQAHYKKELAVVEKAIKKILGAK